MDFMYIEEVEWLDVSIKEAILKVANNSQSLICFSCPCSYSVGDVLMEPLECIDTDDVMICENMDNCIEKMKGIFQYKLKGKLIDVQQGIIDVCGFHMHIDKDRIPGDLSNEGYVQFITSRIDIW